MKTRKELPLKGAFVSRFKIGAKLRSSALFFNPPGRFRAFLKLIYPRMTFVPQPGTTGTLEPVGSDQLVAIGEVGGAMDLYDWEALLDLSTPSEELIFNPTLFRFTTQEGFI